MGQVRVNAGYYHVNLVGDMSVGVEITMRVFNWVLASEGDCFFSH
jgi:hypothetical protein